MKFGKLLKQQVQVTLPDWRDKFLSYKQLKMLVRLMQAAAALNGSLEFGKAEAVFFYLLNSEIDKFKDFFIDKEEEFIILHKELQQRNKEVVDLFGPNGSQPSETCYKDEMTKLRKEMVDFHGEMVHLVNYSNVNYTGLAKILKKYKKRTGGFKRLPFIQKVLEHLCFTTDLISKLMKEFESKISELFPIDEEIERANEVIMLDGEGIFKNTVEALLTSQENCVILVKDNSVEPGSGGSTPVCKPT
ncbi:hypothetical protein RIF29_30001 [Crotalaria pallida]|uniref:SPX domain-containing protein n=1 Tax=Crotalaria pallida TaxID=3830 RepID=A0AAN9EMD2_CROPI